MASKAWTTRLANKAAGEAPPNQRALKALLSKLIDDIAYLEWCAEISAHDEMTEQFRTMRDTAGFWYHQTPRLRRAR